MSYDSVERSIQGAQRVDLFVFSGPGVLFRLCSGSTSQSFSGDAYTVGPISASTITLVPLGGSVREVTISIGIDHPLAIAVREGGVPPQGLSVQIRRIHVGDSGSRVWWQGLVGGVSTDGPFTRIRVPNKVDTAFDCSLPVKVADRRCSHLLGDAGCLVDLVGGGFRVATSVAAISIDGTQVIVASMAGKPDGWAKDGKLVRGSDGEKRTIVEQVGTTITLDFPFRTLDTLDAVDVFAGCDHSLLQTNGCKPKFNNVKRFGGEAFMPTDNPSSPLGLGLNVLV